MSYAWLSAAFGNDLDTFVDGKYNTDSYTFFHVSLCAYSFFF